MSVPPTFTFTANAVLLVAGIVLNVNVLPPLLVVGVMLPVVDVTVKADRPLDAVE
jgi:hypothetical protein